jgi:hypothetical protein
LLAAAEVPGDAVSCVNGGRRKEEGGRRKEEGASTLLPPFSFLLAQYLRR